MAKERDKTFLDEWKKLINDFNDSVNKSLAEIRDCKRDIEKMKVDLMNEVNTGQYFRDEDRIVISAPRIIIGNVNKDGNLKEEVGEVIIRGNALQLSGVGRSGKISLNAPSLNQNAMDTGLDGKENVVYAGSQITSRARTIVISSQDPVEDNQYEASFLDMQTKGSGLLLSSEKGIDLLAAPTNEEKKKHIQDLTTAIDGRIAERKNNISSMEKDASFKLMRLNNILSNEKELEGDDDLTRTNVLALDEIRGTLKGELTQFNQLLLDYADAVSELAELTRKKQHLTAESDHANSIAADYKEDTNAAIHLQSEHITLHSKDGDGTWRTNESAGVEIRANDIKLHSTTDADGTKAEILTPADAKGRVDIQARNVSISTADATDQKYTADRKLQTAKFPLVGNVTIRSKVIDMESVDVTQTDENGKYTEDKLTEGSQINMRAEKVRVKTIDHEGKSVGKFSVNSQKISMKATDINEYSAQFELDEQGNRKHPDSMKSKNIAQGSEMLLLSESMNIGFKSQQMASKSIAISPAETLLLYSGKSVAMGTNENDIALTSDGATIATNGKITLSGSGGIDVTGESKFNDKITGGDIVTDNLTANKAVKAPNLTDGMVMSGAKGQAKAIEKKEVPESHI